MKKLILLGSALLFTFGLSKAQGWSSKGAYDNFASSTEYSNGSNGEGIHWFETTSGSTLVLTRSTGYMSVAATSAGGCTNATPACYPSFGVQWGSDASNNPFTMNLSSGADITFDIQNTASKLVFVTIQVEDINGNIAEFEPNVSDVTDTSTWGYAGPPTNHYRRKALNGFTLAANTRKTIKIDLSSVPGNIGGLTAGAYTCSKPADCPTTSYTIDPTKIKDILFLVNFGKNDINVSEGDNDPTSDTFIPGSSIAAYTGTLKIYSFKIGDISGVTGVKDAVVDNSLSVYPNPADESLTVSFKALTGAKVSISDITGNQLISTTANPGDNNVIMNTSGLVSGMYILNIETENGVVARKLTVK
jgi:hypothetical protein